MKAKFIWASRNGYKDIVELLLKTGANINAKNNIGVTPLMYASHVVELLKKYGAKE